MFCHNPAWLSRVHFTAQSAGFFYFQQEGALMGKKCDLPCWEIMNCEETKKCPAKMQPAIPCWEHAREMSDYRYVLQICPDCIVRLLKGDMTTLSNQEVASIMDKKLKCRLGRNRLAATS